MEGPRSAPIRQAASQTQVSVEPKKRVFRVSTVHH